MRFVARLRRLARLAALIPPADPLRHHSEAEIARAAAIIEARSPIDPRALHVAALRGEAPPVRPPVSAADAAWFLSAMAPLLPRYEAFLAAREQWQARFQRLPHNVQDRFACIFPAFAEGAGWRRGLPELPGDLVAGLARLAGEGAPGAAAPA
jgi:hypothetical protein